MREKKDKKIKDSVHGYIDIEGDFISVIDSEEFQRLKYIEQVSYRTLYPAARHDRFIHSLGTYHLARLFSDSFIKNIADDLGIDGKDNRFSKVFKTFRYAALLHDVGHAPFSHTSECFFEVKKSKEYKYYDCCLDENLLLAVKKYTLPVEFEIFCEDYKTASPSPHEKMSATLLINNSEIFFGEDAPEIDFELAARMVIGCAFQYNNQSSTLAAEEKDEIGVKNCLIRLLNSTVIDVDKLDYITRDTQMSGFDNITIDIKRICDSITAIRDDNGWLYPAYRKSALSVIENVFKAKAEQARWIVMHPAVLYESKLFEHCIRKLSRIDSGYLNNIFSEDALGAKGVTIKDRKYCFLSDNQILADLRSLPDEEIHELFCRSIRRHSIWKSNYEYKYFWGNEKLEDIFLFFKPLIDYCKTNDIFVLKESVLADMQGNSKATSPVKKAAGFLFDFCKKNNVNFDVCIISASTSFTPKADASKINIVFPKLPKVNNRNYTSFNKLQELNQNGDKKEDNMFYLYWPQKLSEEQMTSFKNAVNSLSPSEI